MNSPTRGRVEWRRTVANVVATEKSPRSVSALLCASMQNWHATHLAEWRAASSVAATRGQIGRRVSNRVEQKTQGQRCGSRN